MASVLHATSLWKQGFFVVFVAVHSITVSMFNHTVEVEKMMYLWHWTQRESHAKVCSAAIVFAPGISSFRPLGLYFSLHVLSL